MKQLKSLFVAGAAVAASAAAPAFAAGEVAAGITAVQTEVTTYIGLGITAAFALLALSLAPDIGIGLVKKWVRKGAK
ncbi:hypothetical protein [Pseudomonas sp. TCU-HL1]|uniref:hypothetical protein n=1 Tax=Pseudomonas sp. TCU-HL1 TaxID=1856685 RepID=UPI00083E038B|nr:hypothetical protein [Pseudomonas sp. TCU-HL1]AOE85532.1 hypothetical protein THL1_2984 [Pseudomonas sp. TCU-HL1]AOE85544.1 hypothetical protein THL1_2996 [Pseudomonas sp. TCU-HL1]